MLSNAAHDEKTQLNRFIYNKENTMNSVVSNSVASALLTLQSNYFGETPDQKIIDQAYNECVKELKSVSLEHKELSNSIENIIQKTEEKTSMLDVVTLSVPVINKDSKVPKMFKNERYEFPLKTVLPLVWRALHDDKKYCHNYKTGGKDEKLKLAHDDRKYRLNTFYHCLEELHQNPVCHHGIRNRLVFTLNHIHEDVRLLEDEHSTISSFLKEKIHQQFWDVYQDQKLSAEKKKTLKNSLITWIKTNNANDILLEVDPNKSILHSLEELFIKNAINIEYIHLDKQVHSKLACLDFSCDLTEHRVIYNVNAILNFPDNNPQEYLNRALVAMQKWITEDFELDQREDQNKINRFWFVYKLNIDLNQHHFILSITGKDFSRLLKFCEDYFKKILETGIYPVISKEVVNATAQLSQVIEYAKKDSMSAIIENFFCKWFLAESQNDKNTLKLLYTLLLREDFKEKVILTDQDILKFLKFELPRGVTNIIPFLNQIFSQTGEIDITPYIINRVFLQTILQIPNEWSPLFKVFFKHVLEFVENKFNQPNVGVAASLSRDSYPEKLLTQLDYYLSKNQDITDEKVIEKPRPKNMLIVPWLCQTPYELKNKFDLLDEKIQENLRITYAIQIYQIYKNFFKSLPADHFIYHIKYLLDLPIKILVTFLKNELGREYLRKSRKYPDQLNWVFEKALSALPQNDQIAFLEYFLDDTDACKIHIAIHQSYIEVFKRILDQYKHIDHFYDGITPLIMAVKSKQSEIVKILLDHKANPDLPDQYDNRPLLTAITHNHFDIVKILLDFKANPNLPDKYSNSPLLTATRDFRSDTVKILLDYKANPNLPNEDGITPLLTASRNNHSDIVKILLDHKANPDLPNEDGVTPLLIATLYNYSDVVKILLDHKANPDLADKDGDSPLLRASRHNYSDVVKILLDYKANPNLAHKDSDTPLLTAITHNHFDIVKILLDFKANPNLPDKYSNSPLLTATRDFRSDTVKILLDYKANPNLPNRIGVTPLLTASRNNHSEIVKILLDHKANPDLADKDGDSPLLRASRHNYSDVVKILLDYKANPNFAHKDSDTPLLTAIKHHHSDVVKILLDYKANPNLAHKDSDTPLLTAIKRDHSDVVKILLDHKANPDLADKDGDTPLLIAIRYNHSDVVKILLNHKANQNLAIENGNTPLITAARLGLLDIIKILLENKTNQNITNESISRALHWACQEGHTETVVFFLSKKITINKSCLVYSDVLIEHAKSKGKQVKVENLLKLKNNGTIPDEINGFTELHLAIFFGHVEIVKLLLKHGSDLTIIPLGISGIDLAIAIDHKEIHALLLSHLKDHPNKPIHSVGDQKIDGQKNKFNTSLSIFADKNDNIKSNNKASGSDISCKGSCVIL